MIQFTHHHELKLEEYTSELPKVGSLLSLVRIYFQRTTGRGNVFSKRTASSKYPKIKPFEDCQLVTLYGVQLQTNPPLESSATKMLYVESSTTNKSSSTEFSYKRSHVERSAVNRSPSRKFSFKQVTL